MRSSSLGYRAVSPGYPCLLPYDSPDYSVVLGSVPIRHWYDIVSLEGRHSYPVTVISLEHEVNLMWVRPAQRVPVT